MLVMQRLESCFNLHSIMFLFQWTPAHCRTPPHCIYIPLCFYFNATFAFNRNIMFWNLHSIMFLFQCWLEMRCRQKIFIYIPLCFYFNGDHPGAWLHRWSFTFHYVSISIDLRSNPATSCCNLHSIMFLFQSFLYACGAQTIWFTFHYVSISIYTWSGLRWSTL